MRVAFACGQRQMATHVGTGLRPLMKAPPSPPPAPVALGTSCDCCKHHQF